ncbi:MAG: hypothetical protein ACRENB_01460 [Gemmatimonadales bacterium]
MTARLHALLAAAALGGLLVPDPAVAQDRPGVWIGVLGTSVKARSRYPSGVEAVSGAAIGGEGGLFWKRLALRMGYLNGSLTPDTAGPSVRDYIEGYALVGVRPIAGLELSGGPRARAFVRNVPTPPVIGVSIGDPQAAAEREFTQRWLTWEIHGRYEGLIVRDIVGGYGELWAAVTGSVNNADAFDRARGAAAGIVLYLARRQIAVRLGYALDETRLGAATWRETIRGLTLGVGYGQR